MARRKKPKYIIVGGNPFLVNTKGLRVLGHAQDTGEVRKIIDEHYYDTVGLMIIIDAETGNQVTDLSLSHELFQSAKIPPVMENQNSHEVIQEQLPIP